MLFISLFVNSLFWIMAAGMPILANMPKKLMITVATATMPKSSGLNRRANIAVIIKEMTMPEYLAIAV